MSTNYLLAVSWSWLGHTAVFIGVVLLLLVPGAIQLARWKNFRVLGTIGFAVTFVLSVAFLYLRVGLSTLIDLAIWVIEHRIIVFSTVIGIVVVFVAAWVWAERHHWVEADNVFAKPAAFGLGALGAVVLSLVLAVGFAWNRRYEEPVDVNTAVPNLNTPIRGAYVALGDSYSAGEGLSPYLPGARNKPREDGCHRSPQAHSQVLHTAGGPLRPVFRACSGARSGHVFLFAQNPVLGIQGTPGLLNGNVGLVTLMMGGNDVHFSDVLRFCGLKKHCLTQLFDPGAPATDEAGTAPRLPLKQWAEAMLPILQTRLETVFSTIRQAVGPDARIVVTGYPRLLPANEVPRQFDGCDAILSAFDQGERKGLSELEDKFNKTIFTAARHMNAEYIDTAQFFDSHEACGEKGELLNDVKVRAIGVDPGAFHPRAEGQLVLARELSCYLNEYPTPPHLNGDRAAPGSIDNPIDCNG